MFIAVKQEIKRTPVNLIISKQVLDYKLPYYCVRCRSYIFSINKDLAAIWEGEGYPDKEIPNGMGWVNFYCHGCKRDYNFYFQ